MRRAIGRTNDSANTAAIVSYNADHDTDVEVRQVKYLNNIVEQDHRAIKRRVKVMLGFKAFWSAAITISGIEIMHMIRKDQLRTTGEQRPGQQFYSLALQAVPDAPVELKHQ